ncbi:MAG: tRNA guanosine(34) transglycosylase Tgt [Dehalococcoidia bacterium]|nr:tRNA guanosine(34) transglycosylase Tgt [Dehalococcoidia bacterium]
MAIRFTIVCKDRKSLARAGVLTTPHGVIETPAFISVATQASVKGVSPAELLTMGAQVVLGNTYHLHLRPGEDIIARGGGLAKFMGWPGPTVTDSGGFQAFSLGAGREQGVGKIASVFPEEDNHRDPDGRGDVSRLAANSGESLTRELKSLVSVDEEGVSFISHLDGTPQRLTPESSMAIQKALGADLVLAFDECTSPLSPYEYVKASMERTHRWALRCLEAFDGKQQALFGIAQGGEYRDLREESARFIGGLAFEGLAIGGSLGKSKADMHKVLDWTVLLLPDEKPRHLLGIGEPEDLLECIARGIDLFDCASPTRIGRNGTVLSPLGRINVLNARFREDAAPIQEACGCYCCSHFSRAYLNHLFKEKDELGPVLCSIHNLYFTVSLTRRAREAIMSGEYKRFKDSFLASYSKRAPK